MIDLEKANRERTRWIILQTTHIAGPHGVSEGIVQTVLGGLQLFHGQNALRRELDYLEARELIKIGGRELDTPEWSVKLTRVGYDVVEGTVPCDPGIARPPKYWQGH